MAKCECCGKGVTFGIKVSHSHRRSNRTWKPNVRCLCMLPLPARWQDYPRCLSLWCMLPVTFPVAGFLFLVPLTKEVCFVWRCPATPSCC